MESFCCNQLMFIINGKGFDGIYCQDVINLIVWRQFPILILKKY